MLSKKIKWIIIIVILVFFMSAVVLPSVAKELVSFDSPQSAYEYWFKGTVYEVIEGNDIDYVVGSEGGKVLKKDETGWKNSWASIGVLRRVKTVGTITIQIMQFNFKNEFFIQIRDSEQGKLEIRDSYDSKIYYVEPVGNKWGKYYLHVEKIDKEYVINVNGQDIVVMQ